MMMDTDQTKLFRRILIPLIGTTDYQDTLIAAALLASRLHTSLTSLFVEDRTLLSIAELPCVREVTLTGRILTDLDRPRLEHGLKRELLKIRASLERLERNAPLKWELDSRQGLPGDVLASMAGPGDLVVLYQQRDNLGTGQGTPFPLEALAFDLGSPLLLLRRRQPLREGDIIVVCDTDQCSPSVMALAKALSGALGNRSVQLLPLPGAGSVADLKRVLQQYAQNPPSLVVLPEPACKRLGIDIAGIADQIPYPVLVVKPTPEAPEKP
ncbi:hypothetical protein [Sneathiella chinensis]|uniref:UspA domain-containing protein n=1 Tax=Sneathiella chinensis TaxID=349750 RepID=A0ABQ5TZD5_9PROT|nr:hypothetical protein [Sneathiella chinensis]GLQ04801.1 hypothetical protein GCM10007924_00220 [Sneathiella chinensis]